MGIDEIDGKQRCGETHDTARYRNGGGKPDTAVKGDADPDAPNKFQHERTEPACSKTKVRRLVRKMTNTANERQDKQRNDADGNRPRSRQCQAE
jgi:hypothetical protein